jgi:hypothetical protein
MTPTYTVGSEEIKREELNLSEKQEGECDGLTVCKIIISLASIFFGLCAGGQKRKKRENWGTK